MTNNSGLPFALTNASLAEWLGLLDKLPLSRAANQLNQVLKQLKNLDCNATELLPLLIDLTPLTLRLASNLNTVILAETNASDKSAKAIKLCLQLPRQLSLIFCQSIEGGSVSEADLPDAIFHALQLIGYCNDLYALHYEMQSATLWKKSALLYQLTIANACLTTPIASRIDEFKTQATIEAVFKRNLLFSVINPTVYSPEEIKLFFPLTNQLAPKLELCSGTHADNFGFYWDLNSDSVPCPAKHVNRPLPDGFLGINAQAIGHALHIGEIGTDLPRNSQNKLALHLTGYGQIFSSIIPGLPSRSDLILGFSKICAYLQEQNKLVKIRQLSAQISGTQLPKRNMSLVPLEHERNVFETTERPFSNPQAYGRTVNILKTPHPSFTVAEGRTFDCSTGDVALVYKEQHPDMLVIIRQQSEHDLTGSTHILLEKIPGPCGIYSFSTASDPQQVIVVGEDGAAPEAILPSGKYSIGTALALSIGKTLRLKACLEANAFFARFRVSFDS